MNTPTSSILRSVSLLALLAGPLSAFAAPRADARSAALVTALQAVSPDPLGGRLGLAAASARALENRAGRPTSVAETAMIEADRKAYAAWKNTRRS